MCPAFPDPDYYGTSAPPDAHQPAASLPAAALAVRRTGGHRWFPRSLHADQRVRRPAVIPAASPRLRRRPSPWPSDRTLSARAEVGRHALSSGRALHPGPHPPGSSRFIAYGTSALVPVRTPSRLASRTRAIWQYWHVPSLSGLLPALTGTLQVRLPPASPNRCDGQAAKVSHLHSVTQRLAAHQRVNEDHRIHRIQRPGLPLSEFLDHAVGDPGDQVR